MCQHQKSFSSCIGVCLLMKHTLRSFCCYYCLRFNYSFFLVYIVNRSVDIIAVCLRPREKESHNQLTVNVRFPFSTPFRLSKAHMKFNLHDIRNTMTALFASTPLQLRSHFTCSMCTYWQLKVQMSNIKQFFPSFRNGKTTRRVQKTHVGIN